MPIFFCKNFRLYLYAVDALKRQKQWPALCPLEISRRAHKVTKIDVCSIKFMFFSCILGCPLVQTCMGGSYLALLSFSTPETYNLAGSSEDVCYSLVPTS